VSLIRTLPAPVQLPPPGWDTPRQEPYFGPLPPTGAPRQRFDTAYLQWRSSIAIGRSATELWWLHPIACTAVLLLVYASFMAFDFERVVPRVYVPGWHYAWGAALLVAMAVGMAMTTTGRRPTPLAPTVGLDVPAWAMGLLLIGALFAYAVWFTPLLSNPQLLMDILHGERSSVRDIAATTPGVTTMTQFGVAYVIAFAAMRSSRARELEGWEYVGLMVVFALAAMRAVAWSERLAVIELVVAYVVARMAYARVHTMRAWRWSTVLPLAAPALLYVAFTGTEYLRSWEYYRTEYDTVWAFSFERLVAYYATATNNGIGMLVESHDWPIYTGRFVLDWLYLSPGIGDLLHDIHGDAMTQYNAFLDMYARPEFNSPTGMFPAVYDLGYAGSMIYFAVVGALIGKLWDSWRRQSGGGVLFYPIAVMFLVELLRFNYFSASRCVPAVLALLLLWGVARPVTLHTRGGTPW
jgi:oligosaccharide repeat unit polymerase